MLKREEILKYGLTFSDVYVDTPFHDPNWVLLRYEKNKRAVEYILKDMEDDSTAIICAHGGSIRNILSYMLCGKLENHWNFKIENAKITVLEYDYGFSVLTKLNY